MTLEVKENILTGSVCIYDTDKDKFYEKGDHVEMSDGIFVFENWERKTHYNPYTKEDTAYFEVHLRRR